MIISINCFLPVINCVRCNNMAKLPTSVHSYNLAVSLRPLLADQWSYSTVHNYDTENVHYMPRMNTGWLP